MWEKRPTREGIYVYMYMYTHVYTYTEYIYICIHIADSVHCTAETNTAFIVKQLYCTFKKRQIWTRQVHFQPPGALWSGVINKHEMCEHKCCISKELWKESRQRGPEKSPEKSDALMGF